MGGARPQITPGVISRSLRLTQQDAPRVRRVAGRVAVPGYVICVFMKGILAALPKKESPEGNYSICLVLTQRPTRLGGSAKTSTSKPSTLFISWRHPLRRAGIFIAVMSPGLPEHASAPVVGRVSQRRSAKHDPMRPHNPCHPGCRSPEPAMRQARWTEAHIDLELYHAGVRGRSPRATCRW